ncbi:MAG: folylpolyglutamate synthase/dihydrofolate synthase family protein [Eubacteriales bacterium]|nr:folylpolyglutamate synthase/dihydrofolate synthase family protein [Eubacteriales bacterium]
MDYKQSRKFVKDAEQYGSVLGLDNMISLMEQLGNPQDDLHIVHIAGTNGKGSTIAYLYSILQEAGYKVGRYVSPTLYNYRERIEVNGKAISYNDFASCITRIADAIPKMKGENIAHPTPFEIETAAAFLHFKDKDVDIVLLEVGMGGATDATNIIKAPELCVITSISMDHMSFLGNTLADIASVKAGIIKSGSLVVTMKQPKEVMEVLENVCRERSASLVVADANEGEIVQESYEGQTFWYQGNNFTIPLAGKYQFENAVLAIQAARLLSHNGFPNTMQQRIDGLSKTKWNGRFTTIHKEPLFIVDGAHNPAAADMLAKSLHQYFRGKDIYFIMGVFADKDYRSVIEKTSHFAKHIIAIETPDNPRALPAEKLAEVLSEYHPSVESADSIKAAVNRAFEMAKPKDVIIAFGSLSFIGKMTRVIKQREKDLNR